MKIKRIFVIVLTITMVFVPIIGNCVGFKGTIHNGCDCISCEFAKKIEKYDNIISEVANARTDFDSYIIYDASELTPDILSNRMDTNTVIIERCIGVVTDKETGGGIILNYSNGYYINYKNTPNVQRGSIVVSYMVYDTSNNFDDDIMERYDFLISK